eukprot:GGOE01042941.1.p2 GENE.GGOE01042941.1~~GGOE01042941.1.p2  ORF type:complete len:273 (+),score=39.83 GGOE01042941.1:63-821(+)
MANHTDGNGTGPAAPLDDSHTGGAPDGEVTPTVLNNSISTPQRAEHPPMAEGVGPTRVTLRLARPRPLDGSSPPSKAPHLEVAGTAIPPAPRCCPAAPPSAPALRTAVLCNPFGGLGRFLWAAGGSVTAVDGAAAAVPRRASTPAVAEAGDGPTAPTGKLASSDSEGGPGAAVRWYDTTGVGMEAAVERSLFSCVQTLLQATVPPPPPSSRALGPKRKPRTARSLSSLRARRFATPEGETQVAAKPPRDTGG